MSGAQIALASPAQYPGGWMAPPTPSQQQLPQQQQQPRQALLSPYSGGSMDAQYALASPQQLQPDPSRYYSIPDDRRFE